MVITKTFTYLGLHEERIIVTATAEFNSYWYGDDYDGNRGVERWALDEVNIDDVDEIDGYSVSDTVLLEWLENKVLWD